MADTDDRGAAMGVDVSVRPGRERFRLATVLATAAAMLLGGVVWAGPASSAVGVPVTYLSSHQYTSTASPTQDKPQSKLWFHDGAWWALMAGAGSSSVFIHELQGDHTWRNTGVLIDSRPNSTGDALWSARDSKLYVASRVTGTSSLQVTSHSYNPTGRTWVQVTKTSVASGGGSESASIDQDSTGRLWVTYTRAARVWVAYSDTAGANWVAGFQPQVGDTTIASDDLSAIVAFGGHSIGVMYSDQESGGYHFAIHKDTDPVNLWTSQDVLDLPGMSDDHINLKQLAGDAQGRVWAAIKTSKGDLSTDSPSDPLIGVLTRSSTGTWSFSQAATVADGWTRPILMIDATNQQLYLFATSSEKGGDILYKKSPLSNVTFTGPAAPFVNATPAVNNASGAKDPVTGSTGLVILAAAHGQKRYAHAEMALAAGGKFDDGGGSTDPAPTVTATSPVDKATGVAVDNNVTATFSEDVLGVSETTFRLQDPNGATVAATVSYASKVATLDPTAPLAAGIKYTATLTGGQTDIRDPASQPLQTTSWSFTTASGTTGGTGSAPVVNIRKPAPGAITVGLATNVSAAFSEAVQGVDTNTFTLTNKTTGVDVLAVVSRSGTTNTWILNPNSNLAPDTWYAVTLTGGTTAIRDLANNPLVTTGWEFLTGPAPRISARTPAVNATGVSRTANVIVTFSEPVQAVDGTTFTLKAGTATVSAVVTRSATNVKQWVLNPDDTLAANTKYTVTVTGGPTAIRDLVGNPFKTLSWTFTTGP